ncbi:hypothetical protein AV540_15565 [Brevibacillus parabrevis]|uniref:response regulator n=1 Tax=Brevibacillus parabrevis TaxID=54914 RepID=UPI0007AB4894|nr:response regulator [Brevibacillus parabrevis]KZE48998.1 hypothetical protein AV540_15565 [Brevibacillus parabrevis]
MIRALLVDDEEHALNLLDILLGRMEGVEVVGKSSNPLEAVSACKQLKPNVVFLDIEMPKMSGMQLLEHLKQEHDELHAVFVTAYNQYAIAAFEQEATDYLLKPIEVQRLNKTVARLQRELSRNAATATADSSPDQTGKALLQIRCFGGFDVFNKQNEKLIWRTAKDKELFTFLTLHGKNGVSRDTILDTLWEAEDYQKAKMYLHTCISNLRRNLKSIGFADVIEYSDGKYRLNRDRVQIDFLQFKQELEKISLKTDDGLDKAEQLLAHYNSPLLPDCDYFWLEIERSAFEKNVLETRLRLATSLFANELFKRAASVSQLALKQHPYSEEASRILMQCYHKTGEHDAVFHTYHSLVQSLNELAIQPSSVTTKLYQEITTDQK